MTNDMIIVGLIARAFLCGAVVIAAWAIGSVLQWLFEQYKFRKEQEKLIAFMTMERKAPVWFTINSFAEHQEELKKKSKAEEFIVERNGKFITIVPVKEEA